MPEINAMEPNSGVIVIYDNLSLFTFLSSDERIETVCCLVCLKLGKLDANGQCVQLLGQIVSSCV